MSAVLRTPVTLSRNLLRQDGAGASENIRRKNERQRKFKELCKDVLQQIGYEFSYPNVRKNSFDMLFMGKKIRLNIKSGADRYIGVKRDNDGGFSDIDQADEIFIVAFDDWNVPASLQIYRLRAAILTAIIEKSFAEKERIGYSGQMWLPLDELSKEEIERRGITRWRYDAQLANQGELVFDGPITWVEEEICQSSSPSTATSIVQFEEPPLMERIKAMLSEHMGVGTEKIEIDVRIKV